MLNIVGTIIFSESNTSVNQEALKEMANNSMLMTIIYIVIVAPILEEIVFRSTIIGLILKSKKWLGILISASLFTIIHSPTDIQSIYTYASMGIVFGGVYMITKNLKISTTVHILNNIVASIVLAVS